jgi:hypothetical protein
MGWTLGSALAAAMALGSDGAPPPAAAALHEFAAYCGRGAELWGAPLCGPVILVDPMTRSAIANEEPPQAGFRQADGVWIGTVPTDFMMANTSVAWAGLNWAVVMLPLPEDETSRRVLMAHESFHRVQRDLGIGAGQADNGHLDARDGRIHLRLEMAALKAALEAAEHGRPWQPMVRDALAYRDARLAAYPGADRSEGALLANEGLAEYTGIVVGAAGRTTEFAIGRIDTGAQRASLIRSFGYVVGPAYGLLLDRTGRTWRKAALAGTPLPELLRSAIGAGSTLHADMQAYGGGAILAEETRRDVETQERRRTLTAHLVDGPTVTFPAQEMQLEFDSNTLFSLGSEGTVYSREFKVRDRWGELQGTGDVLISPNWNLARLRGPAIVSGNQLSGPGWVATVAPGYSLQPGPRAGDQVLRRD